MTTTTFSKTWLAVPVALLIFAIGAVVSPLLAGAAADKIEICHYDGHGGAHLLNIAQSGWDNGHSKHAHDFIVTGDQGATEQDCVDLPPPEDPTTLTVVKHVVGGDASASDFNLHVKSDGTDVTGSPEAGSESGTGYTLEAGTYTVSEDPNANYTTSFSEDCPDGVVTLANQDSKTCTVTNTLIPPPEGQSCDFVSDSNTQVDSHGATVIDGTMVNPGILPPGAWAGITGTSTPFLSWIWSSNGASDDTTVPKTEAFTRTFTLAGPTAGTLVLSSDNGYVVKVNGNTVDTKNTDPTDEFNYQSTHTYDVSSDLVTGTNTLEIDVTNFGRPATTFLSNPGGLTYKLTVNGTTCGDVPPLVQNTCVAPNTNDTSGQVVFGTSGEPTVQNILDGAGYSLNANTDQTNIQQWDGTNNTVNFDVSFLAKYAGHVHTFGYFANGSSTFVPIFRDGTDALYATAPLEPASGTQSFSVPNVSNVVFAIADFDGSTHTFFYTKTALNSGSEQHAVVYNPSANEYVIGFEDLPLSGDHDYNDLVVKLKVTGCENTPVCNAGQAAINLLQNPSFETPVVTSGGGWDIFPSGTPNLDWIVSWFPAVSGQPEVANAEFQNVGALGVTPSDGSQYTELDSDRFGPSNPGQGPESQVSLAQNVATVPGTTYTVSFDFMPRPGTAAGENKVEALHDGTVGASADESAGAGWTTHSYTFVATGATTNIAFRDAGTPNDSLGTFLDNTKMSCVVPTPPTTANLHATKIVCDNASDLPNWGTGNGGDITSSTATTFLSTHPNCHLQEGWTFQWAPTGTSNPGDNVTTAADSPWTSFGPTDGTGTVTAQVPVDGNYVWAREVLKDGFVPFTYSNNNDDSVTPSAGMYCNTDHLHYDNYDRVDNLVAGQDYYCVAFNAPVQAPSCPAGQHFNSDHNCVADTATLTIVKHTNGGDGTFNFVLSGDTEASADITTIEGAATSTDITLNVGTTTVNEESQSGWIFDGAHCVYDNESVGSPVAGGEQVVVDNGDHVTCTFTNTKQVVEGGPDVSITKSVNKQSASPEDQITYTLTVANAGPGTAFNVSAHDLLPSGVAWVSDDGAGSYASTTGVWTIGSLAAATSATLHITASVGDVSDGTVIDNTATVTSDNDPNSENNSDDAKFTVDVPSTPGPSTSGGGGGGGGGSNGPPFTGGGGGGGGFVLGASTQGQVLGVSCGLYMNQHLRQGSPKNNKDQVTKLQDFLNKHGFGKFPSTGIFGTLTLGAVNAFQTQYADEILKPWNLTGPTGLVYLSTLREINLIECPDLTIPLPSLIPWSQNSSPQ